MRNIKGMGCISSHLNTRDGELKSSNFAPVADRFCLLGPPSLFFSLYHNARHSRIPIQGAVLGTDSLVFGKNN